MTMTLAAREATEVVAETETIIDLLRQTVAHLQAGPETVAHGWPNLTMQQLRVMTILYTEGPTRVSVIARRLNVSTPTITGILDRLVRQGLTYRSDDPADRRVVLNALTEQGTDVMEQWRPLHTERLAGAIDALDTNSRDALHQGLKDPLASIAESR